MTSDRDQKEKIKKQVFDFWNTSAQYRDVGVEINLEESKYRERLPVILAQRKNILDLGCGDGNNLPYMPEGASYTGCDCSELGIKRIVLRTDHKASSVAGHVCDVKKLPVPDGSQDALISSYTFEHFLEVPLILEECDRVLAPNGLFVIFGPDFTFPNAYGPPQFSLFNGNKGLAI